MLPAASGALSAVLWVIALIVLAVLVRGAGGRRTAVRAPVVLVLMVAAAAAASSHVALAQPARSAAEQYARGDGRAIVVEARVTGKIERRASGEWEFDAVATRIAAGHDGSAVSIEVAVRVDPSEVDHPERLDVGALVQIRGTARAAPAGDRAVLWVRGSRGVEVLAPADGVLAAAAALRRGLIDSTVGLPAPGAGLIPGLAVGDTSAVSVELDVAMKQSSLSHLTAVSGANCAIVVGLAFAAVAAMGGSRRARVAGASLALIGFILLVTPEPSVVRAGMMAGIAMLGVLLGRPGAGMAILALAVSILLIADPWLAASLGFALSSVATASLLVLARPLAAGLSRRMPRALALALSVPLAAQLACGPLLVLISPTVPLYGVVANLLAGPAAPVATIVGLAACLAAPLPFVQAGLTAIAWLPAAWIAGTAQTVSALPAGQVPWLEGWIGAGALCAIGAAVGVVVIVPRRGRVPEATETPPERVRVRRPALTTVRSGAVVVLSIAIGVVAGGAALTSAAGRLTLPADWSVLACDVGQGDAVLVRSAGAVALIDTGPTPDAVSRCLARAGIDRIDLLVLTHFDLDHAGGVPAVVGRVATVLHGPVGTPEGAGALAALERSGARTLSASAGVSGTLGAASWRVLWPIADSRAYPPGNDAGVVWDVRGGGLPTSLFLADLSASPQRALAASGALEPPYDLVKVAHHGSADQSARLYELAAPAVALITVGAGNTYGHPREEILDVLEQLGAAVARTDTQGVLAVWAADSGVRVWREREGEVVPAG
jgi:competence protein ComEC